MQIFKARHDEKDDGKLRQTRACRKLNGFAETGIIELKGRRSVARMKNR